MGRLAQETIDEIRKLHAKGKSSKDISKQLKVSVLSVSIHAGVPISGRVFKTYFEYFDYLARKKGLRSFPDYLEIRHIARGYESKYEGEHGPRIQKKFEDEMEAVGFQTLGFVKNTPVSNPPEQGLEKRELVASINQALEILKQREGGKRLSKIIRKTFIDGMSLEQIGQVLGVSKTRIYQLKRRALEELYFIVKPLGLGETYFDDMGIV